MAAANTAFDGDNRRMPNTERDKFHTLLAERACAHALSIIRGGIHDASAELSLAEAAWSAAMGDADADTLAHLAEYELTDDDDGYQLREI